MSEHEEREWIPPQDNETILGFGVTEEKPAAPQDRSWLKTTTPTPAVERFATLATGIIMYSALGLVVMLIGAAGFRVFKWAFGL